MRRAVGIAVAGVLLMLVAFTFDTAPLFVPAVAFVVVGVVTPAWVGLSARGASVERRLEDDRVVENEPLEATFVIRRGALGLPGAVVIDPIARTPVALDGALSVIRGAREAQVRIVTRFPRRGLLRLEPPALVVSDALELARTSLGPRIPPTDLLVLPLTEPVRWTRAGAGARSASRRYAGGGGPVEPLAAVDVDGLRPYRIGTPASRIHWPAVARGAGLLERRLAADSETRPLIVLDARGSGPVELLDACVRAAASLALELGRRGGCKLLLSGERRPQTLEPDLAAWPAIHARLALVQGGPGAPAPVLAAGPRPGPVLYVACAPLERLPAGLLGVGSGPRLLVLPKQCGEHMGAPPAFEVTGCYGFLLRARAERAA